VGEAPGKKPSGVLVVDKPLGPTSHDVVARARRALRTREIGHAGTLDPMATGVLVLAVGEATKLVPYLTADDKRYEARLALGATTSSLDAQGEVTETAPVPPLDLVAVQRAAEAFLGEHDQEAPIVSAIKVDGEALHRRARRGEKVEAPVRRVVLHAVTVTAIEGAELVFELHAGKGFYVRSFGRDLARALGTVGHLVALRRTASGRFRIEDAVPFEAFAKVDDASREALVGRLLPLGEAVAALPRVTLTERGAKDAFHGRPILLAEGVAEGAASLVPGRAAALFAPDGSLLAIGELRDASSLRVVRGFR